MFQPTSKSKKSKAVSNTLKKTFAVGGAIRPSMGQMIFGSLANAPFAALDQIIGRPGYEVGTEALPPDATQAVEKQLDTFLKSVIPVKVQNWLKANQNVPITSLQVGRKPLQQWVNMALNIISAGQWSKVKKEVGYDSMFHLYLIINGKWMAEKNEVYNIKPYSKGGAQEEVVNIPINKDITIGEMFSNVKNLENFYSNYDAFQNNCQDATLYILQQNPTAFNVTAEVKRFIKQDVSSLLQNKDIRETSKTVKKITNIGATMNKLLQYVSGGRLSFARGGIINTPAIQFA